MIVFVHINLSEIHTTAQNALHRTRRRSDAGTAILKLPNSTAKRTDHEDGAIQMAPAASEDLLLARVSPTPERAPSQGSPRGQEALLAPVPVKHAPPFLDSPDLYNPGRSSGLVVSFKSTLITAHCESEISSGQFQQYCEQRQRGGRAKCSLRMPSHLMLHQARSEDSSPEWTR